MHYVSYTIEKRLEPKRIKKKKTSKRETVQKHKKAGRKRFLELTQEEKRLETKRNNESEKRKRPKEKRRKTEKIWKKTLSCSFLFCQTEERNSFCFSFFFKLTFLVVLADILSVIPNESKEAYHYLIESLSDKILEISQTSFYILTNLILRRQIKIGKKRKEKKEGEQKES